MTDNERDVTIEALDRAVDALLAVRVELAEAEDVGLPDLAFDEALGQAQDYQDARVAFAVALEELLGKVNPEDRDAMLVVEGAANVVVWRAAEVAWRMGLRARDGR
jgi:hypothetical protein